MVTDQSNTLHVIDFKENQELMQICLLEYFCKGQSIIGNLDLEFQQ